MSHPCLSISSTSRRKRDNSRNDGKSQLQNNTKKKTRITFDVIASMDANDYLSQVIREAKGMPEILIDNIMYSKRNEKVTKQSGDGNLCSQDLVPTPLQSNYVSIDGSAASLSYLLSKRASATPPPSIRHIPKTVNVKEWTATVISNFERLRGYLERSKAKGFGGKQTTRKPLPTMKDRPSWHTFCVGLDEASGNTESYFADEYGDADNNDVVKNKEERNNDVDKIIEKLPAWRINLPINGYKPSVSLLLQMDQVMIRRVLSHLTHYVNLGWSITSGTGRRGEWIYALLARLEKPVHRDDAAIIFGLLKKLTMARSKIDFSRGKDKCNVAKLNVLIVLIGLYFEQGGSFDKIMACK